MSKFSTFKSLTYFVCIYLCSGGLSLINAQEDTMISSEPLTGLEQFVDGLMTAQLKNNHIAGGTISIVKDGKVLLAKGYGYSDIKNMVPVSGASTLFRPGSTSKLFTYTAIMQLVEQGKIDLNADVNTYLTKFKIPTTFEEPIRVINLLTHTGGFEEKIIDLISFDGENLVSMADTLPGHMPERVRPVGQNASYSNYAVALAGHIVELVSGMSFSEYTDKYIFKPLEMNSTTFVEPLPERLIKNMSNGYTFDETTHSYKKEKFEIIHSFGPAGASSSTASDMAKFMLAHLNGGSLNGVSILKPQTVRKMHSKVYSKYYGGHSMAHGFYESSYKGLEMIGHGGDTMYFHSDLHLLPEKDFGVFMSFNTAVVGEVRNTTITAILDQYFTKDQGVTKSKTNFSENAYKYVGEYQFLRYSSSDFTKSINLTGGNLQVFSGEDNTLVVQPLGGKYVQVNENLFVSVDNTSADFSKLTFHLDENGIADEIYLLPFMHAKKLGLLEKPSVHQLFLLLCIVGFIAMLINAFRQRKQQKNLPNDQIMLPRLLSLVSGINLLFLIVFITSFVINMKTLFSSSEPAFVFMPISFTILIIAVLVSIPLVYFTYISWAKAYWNTKRRVSYTLITILSIAFLLLMNFYNLVGFKY